MSVLEQNGTGEWLADRLVEIGDTVATSTTVRVPLNVDPSSTTDSASPICRASRRR
jgi:hypothetical protein